MSDVRIFQAAFGKNESRRSGDISYLFLENDYQEFRELQIYIKIYKDNLWKEQRYTGVISEKFTIKTHISPSKFIKFINDNIKNNYNLFFINPFPQYKYWYVNAWDQGEIMHPGLVEASQALLGIVGVDLPVNRINRHNEKNLCFCNYWVGDQDFWQQYVGKVLLPIYEYMIGNMNNNITNMILSKTSHTTHATLFPFFIERLFSTYIEKHKEIRVMPYQFSKNKIKFKYCLNEFEDKLLENIFDEVEKADELSNFHDRLLSKMKLFSELHKLHFDLYYKKYLHPHSIPIKNNYEYKI